MTAGTGEPDRREWLETNGLGGYAMSTVTGENTRRYHGLLVAATTPPVGRAVLLSKAEETLLVGGRRIDLSTNRFPGTTHPEGFRFLTGFRLDPFPTFTWDVEGFVLEKEVFMPHGENAVCVTWRLAKGEGPAGLEVRPLVAFRDFHALTHENADLDQTVEIAEGSVWIAPYRGLPELFIAHDGVAEQTGDWYRFFEYEEERARGFDFREDLWHPVTLSYSFEEISEGATAHRAANLIASTSPRSAADIHLLRKSELSRREQLVRNAPADPFFSKLLLASDQFLVAREQLTTVIAGYPWFADWGRDTMIALPGLTLATGRPEVAKEILLALSEHVDQGMLPNRFPDADGDADEPEYNTVDATLWYFEAVRQYVEATGDLALVGDRLFRILADIVAWHERGTRYGIRVSADGLLEWRADGEALTWMDARVEGRPVTPREGKPVEIQALWFNALRTMSDFARRMGKEDSSKGYRARAEACRASFLSVFPDEGEGRGLVDCVDGAWRDRSVRPNQLFAVSLHHSMVSKPLARSVLATVEEHLLTPYGLRTLSPKDSAYRGRYEGGPAERDAAYHQGTVWPWLLGAYATAFRRVNGDGPETSKAIRRLLAPLGDFLLGDGLGQLPEIFDGDAPHRPRGCVAQAWSVAEILRVAAAL